LRLDKASEKADAISTPVSTTPAFSIKEKIDDLPAMYLSDIHFVTANLAGIPARSMPYGFAAGGLPAGRLSKATDETFYRLTYYREFVGMEEQLPLEDPVYRTKKYSFWRSTTIISLRRFGHKTIGSDDPHGITNYYAKTARSVKQRPKEK
jgi:Amidase